MKFNINSLKLTSESMLQKVMLLQPKSYNWRVKEFPRMGLEANKTSFGFIAQELKNIFPNLVYSKDIPDPTKPLGSNSELNTVSGYYMVDYIGLIPVLTEAMQEQQKIIESQESRIVKLEAMVQQLLNKK